MQFREARLRWDELLDRGWFEFEGVVWAACGRELIAV
jgi:hypothetical protein